MKKVLALVLAVAMLAALNVGALAGGNSGFLVFPKNDDVNSDDYINNYQTPTVNVGETLELAVFAFDYSDGGKLIPYTGNVKWSTENPKIATVSSTGVVTGVGTTNGYASVKIVATINDSIEEEIYIDVVGTLSLKIDPATVTMKVGEKKLLFACVVENGTTSYAYRQNNWSSSNKNVVAFTGDNKDKGYYDIWIDALSPGTATITVSHIFNQYTDKEAEYTASCAVTVVDANTSTPPVTDPDDPDQPKPPVTDPEDPNQPTTPDRPNPPVVDSGASDDKAPQATDNAANGDKTSDALRSGNAAEVKLTNGSAGISVDTANLLGGGSGKLTLVNNGMTVTIPGGFGKVTEAGRIYYPFDYEQNPKHASDMLAAVKGENARSEAVKAGGVMTLPTTATVTLKTRLTGTVNVYYYNEDTGKFTLVASPVAKDGTVTFATRQMGYFLLTTGRI